MQLVKKGQVGVGWALNPICLVSLCKGEKHTHTGRRCHVVLEPDGSDAATTGRQKLPVGRLLPQRLQKERGGAHALISGSGLQDWETIHFSPFQHCPHSHHLRCSLQQFQETTTSSYVFSVKTSSRLGTDSDEEDSRFINELLDKTQ